MHKSQHDAIEREIMRSSWSYTERELRPKDDFNVPSWFANHIGHKHSMKPSPRYSGYRPRFLGDDHFDFYQFVFCAYSIIDKSNVN